MNAMKLAEAPGRSSCKPAANPLHNPSRKNGLSQDHGRLNTPKARRARTPSTPGPSSRVPKSGRSPRNSARVDEAGLDAEGLKTKIYWETWAAQAVKGLLEEVQKGDQEETVRRSVFSGKIGREPRIVRSPSEESIATEISLLTCSSLAKEEPEPTRKKKKKRRKRSGEKTPPKTDWAKMARERRGCMLSKLMKRDAGMVEAYMGTSGGNADVMTNEERTLLTEAAYSRGLKGSCKSMSTENVISFIPKHMKSHLRLSKSTLGKQSRDSVDSHLRPRTGSLQNHSPSLKYIALSSKTKLRSSSAAPAVLGGMNGTDRMTSPNRHFSRKTASPFSEEPEIPNMSIHGLNAFKPIPRQPDISGIPKVKSALCALQRNTGYGDSCSVMNSMEDERGRFTEMDYGRLPKYPQNIRIAPQLSQVIHNEIKQRIIRPIDYTLKTKDLRVMDANSNAGERSKRNLLIFNWLNSIEEKAFNNKKAPSIYDLEEGHKADMSLYPQVFSGLVEGVSISSTIVHSEMTSTRSTQDDLDDELAALSGSDWQQGEG